MGTHNPCFGNTICIGLTNATGFPTLNQNTTGSAATLTTGRTIAMTGDVVWNSGAFNGGGNVSGAATIQVDAVDIAYVVSNRNSFIFNLSLEATIHGVRLLTQLLIWHWGAITEQTINIRTWYLELRVHVALALDTTTITSGQAAARYSKAATGDLTPHIQVM